MKLLNSSKKPSVAKTRPTRRLSFITDVHGKLAIPVGPRFQVEVPSWNPLIPRCRLTIGEMELDDEKWLGTRVWPLKERGQDTNHAMVGRGRPDICLCDSPGSIECVRKHVFDKRSQLKIDLGLAFWKWKFDVMGEDVSKLWNLEEHRKFDCMVNKNLTSYGSSFMKYALQCFQRRSKASIVSYYLNVYIPRRIGLQTRSGCTIVDSDDDDDADDDVLDTTTLSHKRLNADFTNSSCKYMKNAYVMSCR